MSGARGFTWRERMRYRFDNIFERGAGPVLLLLVAAMLMLFAAAGLAQAVFSWGPGDTRVPLLEGMWLAFVRSLDPGTFGGDDGTHFRFIGLVVTLLGVVAMAIVIGLVSSAIDGRLLLLRKARSLVVESNHSLILGWSHKVASIVSELVEANASRQDAAIVILAAGDVDDIGRIIRAQVPDMRTSRLVLRRGDPSNPHDLAKVNPAGARSIIVVGADEIDTDSATVKTVLAALRQTESAAVPIVTEVGNREIAEALKTATAGRVIVVVSSEVVGRLTAQVTRSSGLSYVHQELLGFSGDEIYVTDIEELAEYRYGDALLAYQRAAPIGIKSLDGAVELNPMMGRVLQPGEGLVVIAEDDAKIEITDVTSDWDGAWSPRLIAQESVIERTLIIGWSHYVGTIAQEIDGYVARGSTLDVVVDPKLVPEPRFPDDVLVNQTVAIHKLDSLDLAALEHVVRGNPYDHILIVCYRDVLSMDDADARTLMTLLAVRQWMGDRRRNLVTELLKVEDAVLAEVARPDDFVVSERLMSLALAQISEDADLALIFRDLLDSFSVAVRVRPWQDYSAACECSFRDVVASARAHGESAIGWRCGGLAGQEGDLGGGIFINPPKSMVGQFAGDDYVIVIG